MLPEGEEADRIAQMYSRYRPYKMLLMLADAVLVIMLLAASVKARPFLPGRELDQAMVLPAPVVYVMVALLWHLMFGLTGVYALERIPSFSRQVGRLTFAHFLAVFTFAGLLYFTYRETSRMLVIYFAGVTYITLVLARFALTLYLEHRPDGIRPASLLIVGASESGRLLAEQVMSHHEPVIKLIGFVDDTPAIGLSLPSPIVGSADELPRLITEHEVDLVVIALPESRAREIESLVYRIEGLPVRIYLVPDMLKIHLINADVERFGDIFVIGIREPVIRGHVRVAKRLLDLVLSVVALVLGWPLLLAIWVAIRLDSPGPAVFSAKRVGENGKIFKMLKFRTMYVRAADVLAPASTADEEGNPIFKVKDDPRVTRVGRWLRRTSLDELPQLLNVVKGEMSLVGPRPEQPFITEEYDHWQWQRLSVPPGMTGWWQVSGRSDLPMHLNTHYDLYYVRNWSIVLDLRILLKTIGVVLWGKGAY